MPVKFSPSFKEFNKQTKAVTMKHDYIKCKSKEDLIDYINNGQKPKIKQKCRNELARRGVKLVYVTKTEDDS